jgi:hypothetical protein
MTKTDLVDVAAGKVKISKSAACTALQILQPMIAIITIMLNIKNVT